MDTPNEESSVADDEALILTEQNTTATPTRRLFILELPVFLLFYAWNVSTAVLTDQIVYQACTVSLGINESECALLGKEHESPEVQALEARVQPYSADILMVEALSESILPAALNLFIGPWSDRYGRKPVLVCTFTGTLLYSLSITAICFLSGQYQVNPWMYTVAFIPSALSGGICTLTTTVYCYIADVSSEQERGGKMANLEVSLYVGMLLGNISSSYILKMANATTVFAVASGSTLLAVLYIIFIVKESRVIEEHRQERFTSKLSYFFRPSLVADTFKTTFKRRQNYDRAIILLGISALGGAIFACEDIHTVFFLFLRNRFNWSVRKYSFYMSADTVFMILGNLLGSYGLQKVLGFTEAGIASIAYFCCILNSITIAVAFLPIHLYLAIGICMLKGIADPMTRAFISNTGPPEDVAKIFCFSSTFEALMPLLGAPLYTLVYKRTLSWYPGAFSWISASVYAVCYCSSICVCILQSMRQTVINSGIG